MAGHSWHRCQLLRPRTQLLRDAKIRKGWSARKSQSRSGTGFSPSRSGSTLRILRRRAVETSGDRKRGVQIRAKKTPRDARVHLGQCRDFLRRFLSTTTGKPALASAPANSASSTCQARIKSPLECGTLRGPHFSPCLFLSRLSPFRSSPGSPPASAPPAACTPPLASRLPDLPVRTRFMPARSVHETRGRDRVVTPRPPASAPRAVAMWGHLCSLSTPLSGGRKDSGLPAGLPVGAQV